jgi:CBS domain containing-hemolysin-like protein
MEALVPVVVIGVLLLANALCVAAEFAIVGAPRASLEHQAQHGSRLAKRVLATIEDPRQVDRYIATTQIGISVASLGLGMYGEHWLAERIGAWLAPVDIGRWVAVHTVASILAVALLTYLHIVFGEMVPKTLALQRPHRTVLYVSPPIEMLARVLKPFVWLLNAVANALLRQLGIERVEVEAERYHTAEEIQYIVEESEESGLLRGEAGQLLRELFEFGDLTAGEVMVPRVQLTGVPVGAEADELRGIVRAHPHTRYPVFSGDLDNIVGSLHIKDVLRHLVTNQPVTALDARRLPYVPGPAPLDEVLASMRRYRAQMAVVMDQHGGTAGLVTMENLFEEVVGEIEPTRERSITPLGDGRFHVRGRVRLSDAGDALGRTLDHLKVTTVSGLVLARLGRPAMVGDVVQWNEVRIEVTEVAGRGVADTVMSTEAPPR